ncbi:ABC transporter ATP-binding protein/permease [Pseudomonas oryzae]|uniref:Putative ATP-binding cassette transporter n=1 Tax=Pseudomonas oryzae TaxID=1392877 RepID=A0A1H1XL08_9PSED|nr:ABC transporter ATP-binding protein/permease [Pseudomonas oryzae]SDT09853.1 putative ATP-binding cassette transporter [Pseudomonas oryzae]
MAPGPSQLSTIAWLSGQLWPVICAYWRSGHKWRVRGAVLLLILLTEAQVGLAIWLSYWNRELFDALEARSLSALLLQVSTFVVIFVLTMLVTAVHLHVKRWLQLDWRRWLTRRLLNQWLPHAHHYQLQFTSGEHDNPDGRIAEDIRIATETAVGLALSLLYSLLILGSFIDILLSVSGSAQLPGSDLVVPGYLVLLAFLYAGAGTAFGLLLGRPLVNATNRLQAMEANLRFGLARARENAESIALMHGEGIEQQQAARLFADVGRGWNRQTLGYLGIVAFSTGYGTLLPVFPLLAAAPQYIAGTMTLGILMQAAQAFQRLTSALSWPIDNLGELARCRASADRVASLYHDLRELEELASAPVEHRIDRHPGSGDELVLRDLSLAGPDGRVLVEHLDEVFRRGERVLIDGDASAASSLFKAVAGLWPWGSGEILLPANEDIMFLPQRPFLPDGSLQAVLNYPHPPGHFPVAALEHALHCAGLDWLAPRLNDSDRWDTVLPLRAQQRLGIARLLLQRPAWVFIEEGTDAFDPRTEDCMTGILQRELLDSTLLTVSLHGSLERYFTRRLSLARVPEERYLACAEQAPVPCALRKA